MRACSCWGWLGCRKSFLTELPLQISCAKLMCALMSIIKDPASMVLKHKAGRGRKPKRGLYIGNHCFNINAGSHYWEGRKEKVASKRKISTIFFNGLQAISVEKVMEMIARHCEVCVRVWERKNQRNERCKAYTGLKTYKAEKALQKKIIENGKGLPRDLQCSSLMIYLWNSHSGCWAWRLIRCQETTEHRACLRNWCIYDEGKIINIMVGGGKSIS